MNTDASAARSLDEAGLVVEAIAAYEARLDRLSRDEVMDLAFLYGLCWDYGWATEHGIAVDVVRRTAEDFQGFIDESRRRLGDWDDLRVVELYLPWAFLGLNEELAVMTSLEEVLRRGDSVLPVLALWHESAPKAFVAQRDALLSRVANERTTKAEYIRSVLRA